MEAVGTGARVKYFGGHGTILSVNQYNECEVKGDADGKVVKLKMGELQVVMPNSIVKEGTTTTTTVTRVEGTTTTVINKTVVSHKPGN